MSYRLKVDNKRGVVLILTFIFMVSLVIITTAYLLMATYGTRNINAQINNSSALYLAEAGLNKAIWFLMNTAPDRSDDGSWRTTAYPAEPGGNPNISPTQEPLGDGTYTMWVEDSGSNVLITGRGTMNNIRRIIQQEVSISEGILAAFNDALYTGQDINTSGAVNLNITGSQTEDGADLPTVDFSSYQAIASAGQDISGAYTFTSDTYSGIWYIAGNVTINSNVTINGTVIATGSIKARDNDTITINPTSSYPALVSNGEISFRDAQDVTISGLVYAGVDGSGVFNARGAINLEVTNTIIAGQGISFRDSQDTTITYDSSILTSPPPYFSGGAVIVTSVLDTWGEIEVPIN